MARLLCDASASVYAYEAKRPRYTIKMCEEGRFPSSTGPSGPSAEEIKEQTRSAGLKTTGKRYDLVLRYTRCTCTQAYTITSLPCFTPWYIHIYMHRLLQHKNGVGEPETAPGSFLPSGEFVPKQRAKSMTIPDSKKLDAMFT